MANVGGDKTKRVNAQSYEIFISSVSNEWLYLQDARLSLSHQEIIEATTAGVNVPYSGLPKNTLSGTTLFTTDMYAAAVAGLTALSTKSNNEYPIFTLLVRLTDASGGTTTLTFTSGAKLQSWEISRGKEGASIVSLSFVMWIDPTVT
jgi:hypothetical protein